MKVLIPVIFTAVIARSVAGYISDKGIFEMGIAIKKYPWLDHTENKHYDIIQVKDIMSTPVETIGPKERAGRLVDLLKDSSHNGFPVVDPSTQQFLGLVRRDQLVALLECGIFENDDTTSGIEDPASYGGGYTDSIGRRSTTSSDQDYTPKAGSSIHKSPLMHLAYHIKDDRYDHLNQSVRMNQQHAQHSKEPRVSSGGRSKSKRSRHRVVDSFDQNVWLDSVLDRLDSTITASQHDAAADIGAGDGQQNDSFVYVGEDSLPPLKKAVTATRIVGPGNNLDHSGDVDNVPNDAISITSSTDSAIPASQNEPRFASVGTNDKGQVIIEWMKPEHRIKWINVGAVMNLGTYTVTEFCPVSKAHYLFTALGLRHLIVLGHADDKDSFGNKSTRSGGGKVVGVITRINLLKEYIQEKTGIYDM